jgi:hypothetical protein
VKFGARTTYFPTEAEIKAINTTLFQDPENPHIITPDYRASQATQNALRTAINFPKTKISEVNIRAFAEEKRRAVNAQNLSKGLPLDSSLNLKDSRRFFGEIQSEVPRVISTLKQLGISSQGLEVFKTFVVKTAPMMELTGHPEAILHALEVAENCAVLAKKLGASDIEVLQSAIGGVFHDGLKLPPAISFVNLATHPPLVHAASKHIMLHDPEMKATIDKYLKTLTGSGVPTSVEAFVKPISDGLIINNDSKWVTENVIAKTLRDGLQGTEHEHLIPRIEALLLRRFEAISSGKTAPKFTPEMLRAIEGVNFETGLRRIERSELATAIESLDKKHSAVLPNDMDPAKAILNGKLQGSPEQKKAFISALFKQLQGADAIKSIDVTGLALLGNSCEMPDNIVAKVLGDVDQLSLRASKLLKTEQNGPTAWHRLSNFMHNFYDNVNGVSPASRETAQLRQRAVYVGILLALEEVTGNNLTQYLPSNFKELSPQQQSDILRDVIVGKERWAESSLNAVHARWVTKQGVDLSKGVSEELIHAIEKYENRAVKEGTAVYQELLSKIAQRGLAKGLAL